MTATGVLFDIDGTLVDTNWLHAIAWRRAFLDQGHDVPTAAIHRCIGMGSSLLLERLLGHVDKAVKQGWRQHFDELKPQIRALPGAADLLRATAARGLRVVLATSSEPDDVDALRAALGCDDIVHCVTSAGDVDEAKPEPDVFRTAMDMGDLNPARVVVVGDTVWDIEAARRCGLPCIAVRTGGIGRHELAEAGAVAVYDGPDDLCRAVRRPDGGPLGHLLDAVGART